MDPLEKKPDAPEAQNTQLPRGTFMPQSKKEVPFEEHGFDAHPLNRGNGTIPTFRTFETDTIDTIKNNNESLASITLAEHLRRTSEPETEATNTSGGVKLLIALISIILLGAGMAAIWLVFFTKNPEPVIQPVQIIQKEIVPTDASSTIRIDTITRDNIINAIQEKIAEPVNQTGLVDVKIYSGDKQIATDQFLKVLSTDIPPALVRALNPAFAFGLYKTAEETSLPYLVFKVNSYENAFSSMLSWEHTMLDDMRPVLSAITPTVITTASSTASTTPAKVPTLPNYSAITFTDGYIKNRDVRAAYQNRKPLLMYSFVDENTLVITADEQTLQELIARLTKTEFVR